MTSKIELTAREYDALIAEPMALRAEIEQLRALIEAYLENDSQANWDALAEAVAHA